MRKLASIFALLFATQASADISLLEFQAGGILAHQSAGGESYSGLVSWNPEVGVGPIALRGNLGLTLLKSSFDSKFTVIDYEALLKWNFLPTLALEAGGGLQTWMSNGGTHPVISANLAWEFPGKFLSLFNRIFAGYSRYYLTNNATNEFKLGVGFSI